MGLERFVRVNAVLVPILVAGGYLLLDHIPLLIWFFGVAYVTFATFICLLWGLSVASLKIRP
ncbi:hypothetical protein [Natronococcus sp.]|uniref:hypothetical protein n=1 Tax=Natronococcus sp. TaxID=35747 RepID=UPI0025D30189|nr:hypothetical protein [Natronococcus sp.]